MNKEGEPRQPIGDLFPIEKSDLYRHYLEEKKEIEKLKWILSEQLGKDCGYSYAQWIWVLKYRQEWAKTNSANASGLQ